MRETMPHIPVKKSTGTPTVQALTHFDQLYSSVYRYSTAQSTVVQLRVQDQVGQHEAGAAEPPQVRLPRQQLRGL